MSAVVSPHVPVPAPAPVPVPVPDAASALARTRFGIRALRAEQRALIGAVLAGRDALGVLPTGSGKSLTYQLPALLLGPRIVVVVSPLLALIRDQREHLTRAGIESVELDSTLSETAREEAVASIREGRAAIAYVTPERLARPECVALLQARGVALLAVDEAHTIAMWGHDFRPAYLGIGSARASLGHPPLLALTATATAETRAEIVQALGMVDPCIVRGSVMRSNLALSVIRTVNEMAKRVALMDLLDEWRVGMRADEAAASAGDDGDGCAIVYAATVKAAEALYAWIAAMGIPVARYHGDMAARARAESQGFFMSGRVRVMVATKAFGMGVDKPDVRLVVHHAFPDSLESYVQEAGRAGRDGKSARCVLLYRLEDRRTQLFFLSRKYPSRADIEKVCRGDAATVRPHTREAIEGHLHAIPETERTALGVTGLADRLARDTDTRRVRDRARLDAMMRYAERSDPRALLTAYFGEPVAT